MTGRRTPQPGTEVGRPPDAGSTGAIADARATLKDWLARPDGAGPGAVRLRFLQALATRIDAQAPGATRTLLEARLVALVAQQPAAHPVRPHRPSGLAPPTGDTGHPTPAAGAVAAPAAPAGRGPLGDLVATLARTADAPAPTPAGTAAAETRRRPSRLRAPEPPLHDYFRRTWSRLAAEQRVAQSLAAVPGNAGPLNSQQLVYRSLALMREVSPAYLEHFLAHADALAWLETWQAAAVAAPTAARGDGPRRGASRSTK